MSDHQEYLDLCAGFVLDCLGEDERRRLDAHLAEGCAECDAALRDYAESASLLAAVAPPLAPPAALKARVMDAVRAERAPEKRPERAPAPRAGDRPERVRAPIALAPRPARPSSWTWGLAAAAAVCAILGGLAWMRATRLSAELALAHDRAETLAAQLEDTTTELLGVRSQLASEQHWSAVPASQGVKIVLLNPTETSSEPIEGTAFYNPATGEARLVFHSVAKSRERDLELWAIGAEGPVSLGLLQPGASGTADVRVPNLHATPGITAFAVSREPVGGSSNPRAPSGPVVSVGAIQS
jgi:anti-sigma-K factor RskA